MLEHTRHSLTTPDDDDVYLLVSAHIRTLSARPCLASASFVLVPEANSGNTAQTLSARLVRALPNIGVACETPHAYGVWTHPTRPQAYVLRATRRLDENSVFFHRDLVSSNPFETRHSSAERARRARTEFERQLREFERIPIASKSLLSITRYAYSGKANLDSERDGSKTDDCVMSYLVGTYWSALVELGTVPIIGARERLLLPEESARVASNVRARPATFDAHAADERHAKRARRAY